MQEPTYSVVWPLGKSVYETVPLALRTSDLKGKTVCQLWDFLFRGEEIFSQLGELLSQRFPGISFVGYDVFGNTHGTKEREVIAHLPELLRKHRCDAVISGVGA